MKMFVSERRNQIMHFLKDNQRLTVKELAAKVGVSEATLRSDLNQMEEEGLLTRTHGGAVLNEIANQQDTPTFSERSKKNQTEKKIIAEQALQFVIEKQCILLDASSTALELAYLLKNMNLRLTVVTTGLKTALELNENPNINVIVVGGMMTKGSTALEGTIGLDILNHVNIDVMFTSASGLNGESGLSDFNLYEVQLKKELIRKSKVVVALIDHTKIERMSSAIFASIEEINVLITDTKIDSNLQELLINKNIRVIVPN